VKLGKNASDTCALLSKAYGGETVKKSIVFERHKWFKDGCNNMEDDGDNAHNFLQYQGYCSL
jgi:hypothetical protein